MAEKNKASEYSSVIEHNLSVYRGEGQLGEQFRRARILGHTYANVCHVEALINPESGEIEEILLPDPTRRYEREVKDHLGRIVYEPLPLSTNYPNAMLAILIVDASQPGAVVDVVSRSEISVEARATLRDSVSLSSTKHRLAA